MFIVAVNLDRLTVQKWIDKNLKKEQNGNICLLLRLRSGGCFTQPVFLCALGFIQLRISNHDPPLSESERTLRVFVMAIDPTPFMHHLKTFDLTEAQKVQFIHRIESLAECMFDWLEADTSADTLLQRLRSEDSDEADKMLKLAQPEILKLFERASEARTESD